MEKLVKAGLVRSIGVSNFNSEQIAEVLAIAEIKPVTNQVECSPCLNQKQLAQFCKQHDIVLTGYSPLGWPNAEQQTPSYMYDDTVLAIGDKYGKTAAQIVLRYLVWNGMGNSLFSYYKPILLNCSTYFLVRAGQRADSQVRYEVAHRAEHRYFRLPADRR